MNNNTIRKSSFIIALCSIFLLSISFANAEDFKEGKDYVLIKSPQYATPRDKIEINAFFWYGCPHCYQLESVLSPWGKKLAEDVKLIHTPAVMNRSWKLHGMAYYAAKNLGISDKSHDALFAAIHQHKRSLRTESSLVKFFSQFGVSEDEFRKSMHSFATDSAVRRADKLSRSYALSGVPAIIVNDKYMTDGPKAGNYSRLIRILDFLIEKERHIKKKSSNNNTPGQINQTDLSSSEHNTATSITTNSTKAVNSRFNNEESDNISTRKQKGSIVETEKKHNHGFFYSIHQMVINWFRSL